MGHQFNSMSDAQLQAKLAAAGSPVLPISATTRPLLIKKLQSGLVSTNCKETPKHYTIVDKVYSMTDEELQEALVKFGYRVMPVTATTRKLLMKKLLSFYDGTSSTRNTNASHSNKEFCFNTSSAAPTSFIDYKFAPNLSSLKSPITEDTNMFNCDKKYRTNEIFQQSPVEHETKQTPLLYTETTLPTLEKQALKSIEGGKSNMNDYEKNIMQMFQTFSSQQDKRFGELQTNINTISQDMFQNLSNQQEVRFRELLTDLNCARQEVFQAVSKQQENLFKELLLSLNLSRQDMLETLSSQQDNRFADLLTSLQYTKDEMHQLLSNHREKQFQELISNVNRIIHEKDVLEKTVVNLSSKFDEALLCIQKIDSEKIDDKKTIQRLQKKLEVLERRLCLSTMKLKNVLKLNNRECETKEDLCALVTAIGKSVGIHIDESNIRDVYRDDFESPPASLVIDFTTVLKKEALHSAIQTSLNVKTKDMPLNKTLPYLQSTTFFLLLSFYALISTFCFLGIFLTFYL